MRLEVGGTINSNVPHILKKAKAVSCFVATPFNRQHLTTEHGWQPQLQRTELIELIQSIQPVETQLFVDPEIASIEFAAEIGACGVEISCRDFVLAFNSDSRMNEIGRIARAIEKARALKLRVGIAHDLGQKHIQYLNSRVEVDQICVGHTFVADALMAGMQTAFNDYVELL
jgi:pyridoxine 5-phosphate synthase